MQSIDLATIAPPPSKTLKQSNFGLMEPGRVDFSSGLHRKPNPGRVYVSRPAWVHYGHTDLAKQHDFLLDFGFQEILRTSHPERIFYRGYNDQPVCYVAEKTDRPLFFGGSLEATSQEDLERAAKLPGAGPILDSDFPGGGKVVTVVDPDNIPINVIFGYSTVERGQPPKGADAYNMGSDTLATDDEKPRRGRFQRLDKGPAPVHKLGHFGHITDGIEKISEWYQTHFNLRALDVQASSFNKALDMAVFYDIDLGRHYRDHHAFFHFTLFPGQKYAGPHHASFEVHDMDIQQLGHHHLRAKGYTQMWGIGRHLLGSQIFDYWYDPSGFTVEHYTDGDVVNEENEPGRAVKESMAEFQAWSGPLNTKGAYEGDARP